MIIISLLERVFTTTNSYDRILKFEIYHTAFYCLCKIGEKMFGIMVWKCFML